MKNIKQCFNDFYLKSREFLLKKEENSKLKYKNLTICAAVMLAIILAICALIPSRSSNTMMLHPNDATQSSDEVLFEDNQAVAVNPHADTEPLDIPGVQNQQPVTDEIDDPISDIEPIPADNKNRKENNEISEVQPIEPADNVIANKPSTESIAGTTYSLYCDDYSSQSKAEEKKAAIAFATGLISSVVKKDNTNKLLLGPFKTRDEAISIFKKLDEAGLVDECQLQSANK